MNICFFCSARDLEQRYREPALQLVRMVAQDGHTLVWGGSDRGLMGDIATAAQEVGGKIVGISMESLKHTARQNADEMTVAPDLYERKRLLLDRSDAIVTLVGGTGTLDELTEVFEMRRHGFHSKPIIVLNTDNFYEGLKLQYDRMQQDGLLGNLNQPLNQLVTFVDTPEEARQVLYEQLTTPSEPLLAAPAEAV